jgi:hypothetical protein
MMREFRSTVCLLLFVSTCLPAQDKPFYFYHHSDYGSESLINPFFLILSGGYDIIQAENRPNNPFDYNYENGFRNVMSNLGSPFTNIRKYGWNDFIFTEVLPKSLKTTQAQYWPNYTAHLIGSGMSYRMMIEWYRYHRYPYPKIMSGLTMAAMHLLNEAVENDNFVGSNVDPIADLYIFDPLGMVLYSFDPVCRFFSQTLNLNDWSNPFSYDPWGRTIENNGQNFIMKYRLPKTRSWSVFYYYGNHGQAGLSFQRKNGESISLGGGMVSTKLVNAAGKDTSQVRYLTVKLAYTFGLFYDRNNNLLASLVYSDRKDNMVQFNIFPGLIRIASFSPGLFLLVNRDGRIITGIHLGKFPIGLAKKF